MIKVVKKIHIPALSKSNGIISLTESLAKIIDNPIKIKTNGVKVSFNLEIKLTNMSGISLILNPREIINIESNKTRFIGSRKILLIIVSIDALFLPFSIPWVSL